MTTYCNDCGKSCGCSGECRPASSDCYFDVNVDPYDPSVWVFNNCGKLVKVKMPKLNETDTFIRTNHTAATLNYKAEKHDDTITGEQLGDIINVKDLRDVEFDSGLEGNCYEFIFRKFGECGTGCESAGDKWYNWNINAKGAKTDSLRYVRGANVYGCPEYLDVPSNTDQFWYAGWKTNGEHREFGYYQPDCIDELPRDPSGNLILSTLDPTTKQPKYGLLPLDCLLANFAANFSTNVWGTFHVIQGTPGFSGSFNKVTGDFNIHWDDWRDLAHTDHVGAGNIYGKVNWTKKFHPETGTLTYYASSLTWYYARWDVDRGSPTPESMVCKSVTTGGGLVDLFSKDWIPNASWQIDINRTIPWEYTVTLAPGQTVGPLNINYLFVNWMLQDDEGYQQINFQNTLSGWDSCPTSCPNCNEEDTLQNKENSVE